MATHASTQTDRQAGRQAGWQAGTQAARQTDRERETDRQPDRETDSQTDRQPDRQTGRQAGRQRDAAPVTSFLVGSEGDVRHGCPALKRFRRLFQGNNSRNTCLNTDRQTGRQAGRERDAGPVRPSGFCCLALARAPFVSLGGWKTANPSRMLGSAPLGTCTGTLCESWWLEER